MAELSSARRSRPGRVRYLRPVAGLVLVVGCGGPSDGLLTVNGTRLFVHREGEGEPAIVIHGGPVLDHSYLVPHLAPLGEDVELIYYDQRLSGRSDGVVDSASVRLETFVEDLEALRQVLGLDRVHLIAHSWGGLIALSYAIAYEEHVRSLILVSPVPPSAALWRREQQSVARAPTPVDTLGSEAVQESAAFAAREPAAVAAALRRSFRGQFRVPDRAEELEFHIEPDYAERSRQFGFMLPDLTDYDLLPSLSVVDVPTLMIYGEDEPAARLGGEALLRTLPGAHRVVISRAGHFSFIERPRAFLAAVRMFLPR